MMTIRTWDQAEAGLAQAWPSFQPRPQQRKLAEAVTRTWSGNSANPVLLAQAGCGVGKSLGYLIPTIASGRRAVVSVSTKALQDQLVAKDLPTLRETLFPALTFSCLKGRSNYVCLRAADKAGVHAPVVPGSAGERSDLQTPVTDEQWREISVDSDGCVGRKQCPFGDVCFSERARQRALEAKVVVVNTSLLTQDLKLRLMSGGKASLLGEVGAVVVDEAHEMADIVAGGLSTRVTMHRITDTTGRLAYHLDAKDAPKWIARVNELAAAFFNGAGAWFRQNPAARTADLDDSDREALAEVCAELSRLEAETAAAACNCEPAIDPETGDEKYLCEFARRTKSLLSDLNAFCREGDTQDVIWMEQERPGQIALKASPAEVGGFLHSALWSPDWNDDPTRAVLTSATLGVGGDFRYMAGRLGLPRFDDLDVGTPFDFDRQARLYLPPADAPTPKVPKWRTWAQGQMFDLVDAAGGGALLLFTSTTAMCEAFEALSGRFREVGYMTMMQGDGLDNRTLAQRFQADRNSVLFATRSFMTGVDFAGDTCRLVVIDKMPFPVPDEPVFKARCDAADAKYGPKSSFSKVAVPDMSLVLVQAFGRLIRTVTDYGVVAILDSRMRAGWASPIRKTLPPAPLVSDLQYVSRFYNSLVV